MKTPQSSQQSTAADDEPRARGISAFSPQAIEHIERMKRQMAAASEHTSSSSNGLEQFSRQGHGNQTANYCVNPLCDVADEETEGLYDDDSGSVYERSKLHRGHTMRESSGDSASQDETWERINLEPDADLERRTTADSDGSASTVTVNEGQDPRIASFGLANAQSLCRKNMNNKLKGEKYQKKSLFNRLDNMLPSATPHAILHEEDRQQTKPRRPTMMVSPHLRQDWEEHEDHAPAVWEELLFDLVFVSAAIQLSGFMKKDATDEQIATAMIMFFLLWGFWLDYWWLKTRFRARDSLSRGLFFIYTTAIALSVFFMQEGMDLKDSVTVMWSVALLAICLWYLYLSMWVPRASMHIKHLLSGYCLQFLLWSFTYIATDRATKFLWVTGLVCSYIFKTLTFLGPYADDRMGSPLARIPINLHHTAERFGLWIVIILGEVVIACTTATYKKDVSFEQTTMIVFTMMLVIIMCFRYNKVQPTRLRYHSLACGKIGRVEGYMLGHWVMTAAFLVLATGIKLMFYHLPAGDDGYYTYGGGHKLLASPSNYPPPAGYGNETDHHDDHDDSTYAECENRENSSHHCLEEKDVELVCRSLAVVSISMNFIRIGHAQPHSWTASGIGAWVLRLTFIAAEWYLPNFGVDTLHTQTFVLMVLTLLQLGQLVVDLAQDVYNFYLEQQLMAGNNDGTKSNWRRRLSMLLVSVSGQPALMCESSRCSSSQSSLNVLLDHSRPENCTDDRAVGPLPRVSILKNFSHRQRDWSIGHYDELEPHAQQYDASPWRLGLDASPASVHGGVPTTQRSVIFR